MKTTQIPPSQCKACGNELSASTSFQEHQPKEGDFSICGYCGALCKYDKDLRLISVPRSEQNKLRVNHPDIWAGIEYARSVMGIKDVSKQN